MQQLQVLFVARVKLNERKYYSKLNRIVKQIIIENKCVLCKDYCCFYFGCTVHTTVWSVQQFSVSWKDFYSMMHR